MLKVCNPEYYSRIPTSEKGEHVHNSDAPVSLRSAARTPRKELDRRHIDFVIRALIRDSIRNAKVSHYLLQGVRRDDGELFRSCRKGSA